MTPEPGRTVWYCRNHDSNPDQVEDAEIVRITGRDVAHLKVGERTVEHVLLIRDGDSRPKPGRGAYAVL